jgi:putative cell wall-binding protein
LVNRDNWPDAVAAGQLGAQFGYPILLTPPDALAAPTAEALAARNVEQLIVVGGTVRVSETTMKDAVDLTQVAEAIRLAGEERNGTVIAVSAAVEQILAGTELGRPANALVVNVRRDDAYAHMLSATVPVAAFTGVFIPVEEDDGSRITQPAIDYTTGLGLPLALMGGPDLIVDATGLELERLSEITP